MTIWKISQDVIRHLWMVVWSVTVTKSLISSSSKNGGIDNCLSPFHYVQAWYLDWESISLPLHYSFWHCLLLAAFDEMRILFCPDVSICSDGNFSQLWFCISQNRGGIWQYWNYMFHRDSLLKKWLDTVMFTCIGREIMKKWWLLQCCFCLCFWAHKK